MKNSDLKRNKLIIVSLIVILVIILLVLLGIKIYFSPAMTQERYGYEIMGVYKGENQENTPEPHNISFKNIDVLNSFYGEFPVSTITQKIKNIFLVKIPEVIEETESLDDNSLKTYYSENVSIIKDNLRINNESSFIKMIDVMRKINCDLSKDYDTCEFSNDTEIKLKFIYKNNQSLECIITGDKTNNFMLEF